MTTTAERQQIKTYLSVLKTRLAAVDGVKTRIQNFHNKEQRESSSIAKPFRGTAQKIGTADNKMLRAVDAYATETQRIRDILQKFLDSTGENDSEHGGKVDNEGDNEKTWTV